MQAKAVQLFIRYLAGREGLQFVCFVAVLGLVRWRWQVLGLRSSETGERLFHKHEPDGAV